MNTSKQVNVIIGLLMVGAIATLLYYLWDVVEREHSANARQLMVNAERGGALFALNCSSCHGLTGKGALERSGLPGAPLNLETNRPSASKELDPLHVKYLDTITCGRAGTIMPAWSDRQGGSLNDFQIQQLVALITGTMPGFDVADVADPNHISEEAWAHALDEANHSAEYDPPKALRDAVDSRDTVFLMAEPLGLSAGDVIRIDDEPAEEGYELVTILDAPASSILSGVITAEAVDLPVHLGYVFEGGDILLIEKEKVRVAAAPASTELATAISDAETAVPVVDSDGLESGEVIRVGGERMKIVSVSGDSLTVQRGADDTKVAEHEAEALVIDIGTTITVERGVDGTDARQHKTKKELSEVGNEIRVERGVLGTDAVDHEAGAHVFQGPIPPPDSITENKCGQFGVATASDVPAESVAVSGEVAFTMSDSVFDLEGTQNPTLGVKAGDEITFALTNDGAAIHNLSIAGDDDEFATDDDTTSDPAAINGGATGTLAITFDTARTYLYQCDFHPLQMKGEITVSE